MVLQKKPLLEALVKQSPLLDHMPKAMALVLVHAALFDHRQPVKAGCCPRFDQVLACLPQLRKALAAVPPAGEDGRAA